MFADFVNVAGTDGQDDVAGFRRLTQHLFQVADDAVIIKRISETRLVGEAPETIRHMAELRGIGIINVERMYGVSAVIDSKSIDLVVHLEFWDREKDYDRLGME